MIADLKTYPAMKPSGVEWLGEVPEHWQIVPNRALLRIKKELVGSNSDDYLLLSLTKRGVVARNMENPEGKFPTQFDSYQVIEPGNLIFCLFDIDETPRTVGLSSLHGMITGAYTRFVCADETARRFVYLLYVALDNGKHLKPLYTGLRKVITKSTFLSAKMPLPSPPEQAAIVRFLDHADRRIRRYIRAKQKLIKLLEEQKQAIINQAVTGQIDVRSGRPYPAYKASGVEWLGDVPEHWEVSRVKAEFHCLDRRRLPLSGTERGAMILRRYDYYGASGVIDKVDDYLFDDELLLIAEDGANLVLRNLPLAIIARGRFWVNNHAHILKPKRGNLEFLAGMMERLSYLPWISGAAQPKLTQDRLMSIAITVPPHEEQDKIITRAAAETVQLRIVIDRARREIDLLREYRTRLIADVVTGKLDVREAVSAVAGRARRDGTARRDCCLDRQRGRAHRRARRRPRRG